MSKSFRLIFLSLLGVVILSAGVFFRSLGEQKKVTLPFASSSLPASLGQIIEGPFVSTTTIKPIVFLEDKKSLEALNQDFVEVDLVKMKLFLHSTSSIREFPVLTKGREGSWWETPTGDYSVLGKETNHLSSIGQVWMPWSIQFYGNFFIHGWPYHADGTPVEKTYSGGCIRLSTEDAKQVFAFVKKGMPILIHEAPDETKVLPNLVMKENQEIPSNISAQGILVSDLDTGQVLFGKNDTASFPIASLTKLMTGVVASEVIYLERGITISSSMMQDKIQSYPLEIGKNYKAFDLLYPLLMESSNGSARAIASFLGESNFVVQMNEKAKTLSLSNTVFADASGIKNENVSTLQDLARLVKYIADKRGFLFDITRGKKLSFFSEGAYSGIENYNEFAGDARLIGMKNGQTQEAGQTMLSLWKLKDEQGNERRILIGVLQSTTRKDDTATLLSWLSSAFSLQ